MTYPVNFERNEIFARCKREGLSQAEAARRTGCHESIAYYYYHKIDRYQKKGVPFPVRPGANLDLLTKRLDCLQRRQELGSKVDSLEKQGKIKDALDLMALDREKIRAGIGDDLLPEIKDLAEGMEAWRIARGLIHSTGDSQTMLVYGKPTGKSWPISKVSPTLVSYLMKVGGQISFDGNKFSIEDGYVILILAEEPEVASPGPVETIRIGYYSSGMYLSDRGQ